MKDEQPTENQIKTAIADIEVAMIENIKAGKAVVEAQEAKKSARFKLLKAKERLNGLEAEFMAW